MKYFKVLVIFLVMILCPALCLAGDFENFAKKVVTDAANSNWNSQSFFNRVCPSVIKGHRKSETDKGWIKTVKHGKLKNISNIYSSPGYSGMQRIDVETVMSNSEKSIMIRLWIKDEKGATCIYGFNIFLKYKGYTP